PEIPMKPISLPKFALASALLTLGIAAASAQTQPPAASKVPVTETMCGGPVVDEYRWLENLQDAKVTGWLKAQADYANETIGRIPGRDSLLGDFVRLDAMQPATITSVTRKNGRYFYKKTLPTENVGRLYYRDGLQGNETLLFDPDADAPGKGS